MDPVVPMERWPRRRGGRVVRRPGPPHLRRPRRPPAGPAHRRRRHVHRLALVRQSRPDRRLRHRPQPPGHPLLRGGAASSWRCTCPSAFLARRLAHSFEHLSPPDEDVLWAYIARVGARIGDAVGVQPGRTTPASWCSACCSPSSWARSRPASGRSSPASWIRCRSATADPIFGRDVAFFVFTLPFLRAAHSWLLGHARAGRHHDVRRLRGRQRLRAWRQPRTRDLQPAARGQAARRRRSRRC